MRDFARTFGWLEYHPWRSFHSTAGFPDLTMVRAPRVIFAELKTDSKTSKLSHAQVIWAEELKACEGIEYYLWKPSQWEQIIEVLR